VRRHPALLALIAFGLAACGGGSRSAEGYCGEVAQQLETLNAPVIDDGADIAATIAVYRRITSAAPAAIEPEWAQLVASLETASTVDIGDPASIQLVADTARSTRPAATRIQQYTDRTCALQIADPPPPTNPVTATTSPSLPIDTMPSGTAQGGG
jgi:hypothetical protein